MSKFILLFCFMAILVHCGAQSTAGSDLAQLKEMNARFIHNFVTNDSAAHCQILHRDFVCISPDGAWIDRKNYLAWWAHGFDGYKYWDYRDENIKVFGSTALVHAKNKYIVIREGKEITGMSMYTDTYIKENGQWKCVQAQITRLSPANYSGDETIVRKYDYTGQ